MSHANGYTLYEDQDRVVIATGFSRPSANVKTGPMIQVWILPKAHDPVKTIQLGLDSLVCGDCKYAGSFQTRTCYVAIGKAPLSVWKAWKRGSYPFLPITRYAETFYGRKVRLGAYGDPFYIPREIVRWICFWSDAHTGYTHQWTRAGAQWMRELVMASVDNQVEYERAKAAGWRTFRVTTSPTRNPREISCPASLESGHRTTCAKCKLCDGARHADRRASIAIHAHAARRQRNQGVQLIQIGAGI